MRKKSTVKRKSSPILDDLIKRQAVEEKTDYDKKRYQQRKKNISKENQDRKNEERRKKRNEESEETRKSHLLSCKKNYEKQKKNLSKEDRDQKNEERRKKSSYKNCGVQKTQNESEILHNFQRLINIPFDKICQICKKHCYPKQILKSFPSDIAKVYLPDVLKSAGILLCCRRCHNHITSKNKTKNYCPPKAYWNNVEPGKIPEEIKVLSQVEKRLLARVIANIKVVKYDGIFGQYGFRGQVVLFAQNIFEITDCLPRSTHETDMTILIENLADINILRECKISRNSLFKALDWLKMNNPLYSDLKFDENANLDVLHVVKVHKEQSLILESKQTTVSAFKIINQESRIIRASYHQASTDVFGESNYIGKQACAIIVVSIVRSFNHPPEFWTSNTLNENLIIGHELHANMKSQLNFGDDDDDGYLSLSDFQNMKEDFNIPGDNFVYTVDCTIDTKFYGNLNEKICKKNAFGYSLNDGIGEIFKIANATLLITKMKCYGLIHKGGKFYFISSYPCGPMGAKAEKHGTACMIECDNFKELIRICKRATGSSNEAFSIHPFEIQIKTNLLVNELDNYSPESQYIQNRYGLRILRSSTHQGDTQTFGDLDHVGKQSCANVIANFMRASYIKPQHWDSNILNFNLLTGDELHRSVLSLTRYVNVYITY